MKNEKGDVFWFMMHLLRDVHVCVNNLPVVVTLRWSDRESVDGETDALTNYINCTCTKRAKQIQALN